MHHKRFGGGPQEEIRRMTMGAIDVEYYHRRALAERSETLRAFFSGIVRASLRAWAWIQNKVEEHNARQQLSALTEHELKDIGLARSDFHAIVSGAYATDRTRCVRSRDRLGNLPMSRAVCWLNGNLMPVAEARIPVLDHGLLYGDGVFEGIRFYRGRAFRLAQHLNRLYRSASAIRLAIPHDSATLTVAVHDTITAFGAPEGYLRLVVTRGAGKLGIDPASCKQPNVFIIADELSMTSERMRSEGARIMVAATRRIAPDALDPRIKSLNYLNHILARMEATHAGADEAVLLNAQGHVAEGTADNVFVVRNGTLLTPPVSDGALEGITRAVIIDLAEVIGLPWAERSLAPYDLHTAEECFLTGTGAELIPVCNVDGRSLGSCPGPIFLRLQTAFRELIAREVAA